jgi:heme-degrading monooxygenase HmoA
VIASSFTGTPCFGSAQKHNRRLAMFTSTFTFAKKQFDEEFHALDTVIAAAAKSIPGYLGEEAWENPATGQVCNVYYWESEEALQALMSHPAHIAAKTQQARWLDGYQVVIAQVVGSYGDGALAHPLAARRLPMTRLSRPRG